jgi:hypothetical protein
MTEVHIDSSAWTGRFWHIEDATEDDMHDGVPPAIYRQIAEDQAAEERQQARKALVTLWGPPIKDRPADPRKGWTIYDGYIRARGDDWTIWRAIVATFAIITGRRWGQRQAAAADRACARWQLDRSKPTPRHRDSFDLGHWDYDRDGYGWSAMQLHLYPWARVDIFSDGESSM